MLIGFAYFFNLFFIDMKLHIVFGYLLFSLWLVAEKLRERRTSTKCGPDGMLFWFP